MQTEAKLSGGMLSAKGLAERTEEEREEMLVQETLFGVEDKVATSIDALKTFEPPEGYYVAFSGGKDSVVVKALCDMAGVKYDAHYSVTSVDPPELVQFIKEKYPDVSRDIPHDDYGKPITMWNLIPREKYPPTRFARYCCEVLKEGGGEGRFTVTGVRWAESRNRKNNQGLVTVYKKDEEVASNPAFSVTAKGGMILNNDNAVDRRWMESCYKRRKTVLNPIINWEDEDVWEFIHKYNIPYCELYDKGYTRIGCIGCPMNTAAAADLAHYEKYKEAYLRSFGTMLAERESRSSYRMADPGRCNEVVAS